LPRFQAIEGLEEPPDSASQRTRIHFRALREREREREREICFGEILGDTFRQTVVVVGPLVEGARGEEFGGRVWNPVGSMSLLVWNPVVLEKLEMQL
jgi:hypothetical protein